MTEENEQVGESGGQPCQHECGIDGPHNFCVCAICGYKYVNQNAPTESGGQPDLKCEDCLWHGCGTGCGCKCHNESLEACQQIIDGHVCRSADRTVRTDLIGWACWDCMVRLSPRISND